MCPSAAHEASAWALHAVIDATNYVGCPVAALGRQGGSFATQLVAYERESVYS